MVSMSFKLVCFDDSSPYGFKVLDDVNKKSFQDICKYLEDNIEKYDIQTCKWLILPVFV